LVKKSGLFAAAGAIAFGILRVGFAHAQSNEELKREVQELERKVGVLQQQNQQLQGLDQQVKVIDRKLEIQQEQAREEAKARPLVGVSSKGFFLKSADDGETYNLRIGAYVQADSRWYLTQTKPTGSEFLIRRARPYFEGTVAQYYDFRLMVDFGQGATTLQDAYGDVHYWPEFRSRFGKFKEPVGLERLQDDRNLKFVERALPSALVPDRDLGFDFHGELFDQRAEYAIGLFNGVPDNTATVDTDNNDAKDFAARVYFHPFAKSAVEQLEKLGLGVSGTYGDERAGTLDTYKSAGQTTFFTYNKGVVASGPRYRISPQFDYYGGSLGLLGEWVQNGQEFRLNTTATTVVKGKKVTIPVATHPTQISNQAWQLAATYLITGEDATYGAVKPFHDFSPFGGGGLGALELAARIDQLLVDHDAFNDGLASKTTSAQEATEFAVGVNWYLNQNVKAMVDYEHTGFRYGAGKPTAIRDLIDESAVLTEIQWQF
jgi:phosphate-selective porin OprO/OprP